MQIQGEGRRPGRRNPGFEAPKFIILGLKYFLPFCLDLLGILLVAHYLSGCLMAFCPKILGGGGDLRIIIFLKNECSFSGGDM